MSNNHTYTGTNEERATKYHAAQSSLSAAHGPAGQHDNSILPSSGALLRANGMGEPGNAPVRTAAMQQMQQTHGNRAVQRFVQGTAVQREGERSTAGRIAGGAWDFLTSDFLGGPVGLLDEASKVTAPLFGSARAGSLLNQAGNLPGVGVANQILGPVGMISGAMDVYDALSADDYNMQTWGDVLFKGAGATSGAITTTGLVGSGLTAAGATGVGATLSGAAAAAAPVGAVLGAGAAGYGIGRGLDNLVDWIGDKATGNEQADHSISGFGADVMTGVDQTFTRGMRAIGAYDEDAPEHTQTLGWWLADNLPSWMQ
jgi:hypothetical protein